jgi:hypothetical protein
LEGDEDEDDGLMEGDTVIPDAVVLPGLLVLLLPGLGLVFGVDELVLLVKV